MSLPQKHPLITLFKDLAEFGRQWRDTEASAWEVAMYPEVKEDTDSGTAVPPSSEEGACDV